MTIAKRNSFSSHLRIALLLAAPLLVSAAACDGGDGSDSGEDTDAGDTSGGGDVEVPAEYAFESRFEPGVSSVSYGGQVFRQVLISSLKAEMSLIQDEIDGGAVFEPGTVAARLSFYYAFDGETAGSLAHAVSTSPAPLQTTWSDLGSGKNLLDKMAGNDADPQHQDWSTDLIGWDGSSSPEALLLAWFDEADALAVAYSRGEIPTGPGGAQISAWFVSPSGLDYQQLIQKFLLGAVNYSQGTDDYLDEGLDADNVAQDGADPFTALEHAWDEGFGYWGASRDYLDYTDDEIATEDGRADYVDGYHDADGDGAIDLFAEANFGASVNAGKRDRGAAALGVETDLSHDTMQAFLAGRAIITAANGELSAADRTALEAERDVAVDGWERALAATSVHYFNDVLADIAADDAAFEDFAKHWSELKGFLLMLQFNPSAQISDADLTAVHALVGNAPALPGSDDAPAYVDALIEARGMVAAAYAFDAALVGDERGANGW